MLARHGRNMIQLFLNQFIPEACLANNVIETFSRLYHRKIGGCADFGGGSWSVADPIVS